MITSGSNKQYGISYLVISIPNGPTFDGLIGRKLRFELLVLNQGSAKKCYYLRNVKGHFNLDHSHSLMVPYYAGHNRLKSSLLFLGV